MKSFSDLLSDLGYAKIEGFDKYPSAGIVHTYDGDNYSGFYWHYETDDFIIDIHDFFIKKDFIMNSTNELTNYMSLVSNYIMSAHGEWVNPYLNMAPDTMLVMEPSTADMRFSLHGNCPFLMVGISYKEKMIKECMMQSLNINKSEAINIFLATSKEVATPLRKLANEILNCKMSEGSAKLFFEAKAKEWLSLTIDAYMKKTSAKQLSESDKNSVENVAAYINDHYALDINQAFLEKISMMSGTKLKTTFRQRYNMSITEYKQRKRMNIAENLLLNSDLEIRDISRAVGYSSPSRFSVIFKRYKGIHPKEFRDFRYINL